MTPSDSTLPARPDAPSRTDPSHYYFSWQLNPVIDSCILLPMKSFVQALIAAISLGGQGGALLNTLDFMEITDFLTFGAQTTARSQNDSILDDVNCFKTAMFLFGIGIMLTLFMAYFQH